MVDTVTGMTAPDSSPLRPARVRRRGAPGASAPVPAGPTAEELRELLEAAIDHLVGLEATVDELRHQIIGLTRAVEATKPAVPVKKAAAAKKLPAAKKAGRPSRRREA